MPDILTPQQRHHCMSSIHSTSTKPELKLRKELWRRGYRYRINDKRLPGTPDIVLPKYRTVLFVHGCFWHGHQNCKLYEVPKSNTQYWIDKVLRNQARDDRVWRELEAKGWYVEIVWECELDRNVLESTIGRVEKEILANGEAYRRAKEERAHTKQQHALERRRQRDRHNLLVSELRCQ